MDICHDELLGHWTHGRRLDYFMSFAYFCFGFAPIAALAIAIVGILPLSTTAILLIVPAMTQAIVLGALFPQYGHLALKGFAIGLIAVFLYDCLRIPFILAGMWSDFIPNIAKWLLSVPDPIWTVGYAYRYIGDGGGMGMAFTVAYFLLKPPVKALTAGILYGIAIWFCLLGTLLFTQHGQEMLFRLTPLSFTVSLGGHVVYGAALGFLVDHFVVPHFEDTHSPAMVRV